MLVSSFSAVSKVTGSEMCQWFIVAQGSAMHKACLCGSKRKYKSCCGTQCPKLTITSVQRLLYLTHLSFLTQFELRSHVMFLLE
jgi:hypothetical protein